VISDGKELGYLNIEPPYIPKVGKEELRKVKSFEENVSVKFT
jgi:hypothetical protein